LDYNNKKYYFIPKKNTLNQISVGSCNGTFGLKNIISESQEKTKKFLDIKETEQFNVFEPKSGIFENIWLLPSNKISGKTKSFVDYQNDSTANDIKLALREGFKSIEHVKRYTTTGMATDQGKIANMHA